ncbi:MAG: type II toxin-antitoxin system death-on-curing family toxin [Candidatus Methylomirabilis oxygeniifera]|uniref:Death-on-curing family protein n=1 Tax=Methylomirabilis oxygeniifera TaxID=671143 RepID=D5MKV9_METO1|nr:MAG: type II toxin-antitoxin system death-on-curing family toxin [Candidatus Methylomirabilis oxyfera]CBE69799.1 Death-on-curing family protein [Candidatus Methylomirabilis oxyfera]
MAPVFLSLDEVTEIHREMIERYGGSAGIRDMGLLQSAVAMPQASFGGQFLHADLFEMAAAYLFHLVQNHPFIDGNKRVGTAAAMVFLELNGVEVKVSNALLAATVLDLAQGKIAKATIAEFLKTHSRP